MPDSATAMLEDDEAVEQLERRRRDDEEVHGRSLGQVVPQEGPPRLGGRSPRPTRHVLRDGRLRDAEPELEQLTVNPRCAPRGVVGGHLPDECLNRASGMRSSSSARAPAPEVSETRPVPRDDRLRLDEAQHLAPPRPPARQSHPEQLVDNAETGPRPMPPQDSELLAACDVLKRELLAGENRAEQAEHGDEEGQGLDCGAGAERGHRPRSPIPTSQPLEIWPS